MKQNRRSIGSRTGDGNPVSPPDCSFRNMTAPPSNRRVSYAQRSFHSSVPCLRRPDLGRAGPRERGGQDRHPFRAQQHAFGHGPLPCARHEDERQAGQEARRGSHRDSGIPRRADRQRGAQLSGRAAGHPPDDRARGEQCLDLRPLPRSVRPSLHLQERQGIRRLRRSELGSHQQAHGSRKRHHRHRVAFAGLPLHHQQQAARCQAGRPRSGQDPYPQQPDHDRRVPRLGHGPGSHGHGRNLQRPPAEGCGRSGQPAGLHRHQPLL